MEPSEHISPQTRLGFSCTEFGFERRFSDPRTVDGIPEERATLQKWESELHQKMFAVQSLCNEVLQDTLQIRTSQQRLEEAMAMQRDEMSRFFGNKTGDMHKMAEPLEEVQQRTVQLSPPSSDIIGIEGTHQPKTVEDAPLCSNMMATSTEQYRQEHWEQYRQEHSLRITSVDSCASAQTEAHRTGTQLSTCPTSKKSNSSGSDKRGAFKLGSRLRQQFKGVLSLSDPTKSHTSPLSPRRLFGAMGSEKSMATMATMPEDTSYTEDELDFIEDLRSTSTGKWAYLLIKSLDEHATITAKMGLDTAFKTPTVTTLLEVHNDWLADSGERSTIRNTAGTFGTLSNGDGSFALSGRMVSVMDRSCSFGVDDAGSGNCSHLVMSPSSRLRFYWTLVGGLLVLSEVIMLPLRMVELVELDGSIDKLGTLFWIIDLALQFLMGYATRTGSIEMRLRYIAGQYLQTWFCLDASLIIIDLFLLAKDSNGNPLKVFKFLRLLRFARLLRLRKLAGFFRELITRLRAEWMLLCVRIFEQLMFILLANHYIACCWYGVGSLEGDESWVKNWELQEKNWLYSYSLSLHWSLTQFTPATNNVVPTNTLERLFAIVVVIFALVSFSSFISGVTNAVTELRAMSKGRRNEGAKLRGFLARKKISSHLGIQLIQFYEQTGSSQKDTSEADITALKEFPESLVISLHLELNRSHLFAHPLFEALKHIDSQLLVTLCHSSFRDFWITAQHDVFMVGDDAPTVLILESGDAKYGLKSVPQRRWLSELALWLKWVRHGHLVADTVCEFMAIDCASVRRLVNKHGGRFRECVKAYIAFMSDYWDIIADVISDMPLPDDECERQATRAIRLCQLKSLAAARATRQRQSHVL